jgi:hypothetical protein
MISKIVAKLPLIDQNSLAELLNVIEQSKQFRNFNNKSYPSNDFELAYANYIGTGDENFIKRYRTVVIESCFREFMEWYEYLTKHILRDDVQDILGIKFLHTDTNWAERVKQSDIFGWAFQIKNTEQFLINILKVKELGEVMIKFFNSRKPLSTLDDDYFESDHAQLVLDSIDKIIIKNDKQELINHLQSDKILCMIEVYGWENRFNPILLEWIYKNKERIKQWT